MSIHRQTSGAAHDLSALDSMTIHELRDRALAFGAARARPARPATPSRRARLHLIDLLSRQASAGLAAIAGATAFIAAVYGAQVPAAAAVWVALSLAALYAAASLRRRYRAGEILAGRPFRWRAYYTAALTAVSAAFGSGAILVATAIDDPASARTVIVLIGAALVVAAASHAAHKPSVAAAVGPGLAFVALSIFRVFTPALAIATLALLLAGAVAAWRRAQALEETTVRRWPRTRRADQRKRDESRAGRAGVGADADAAFDNAASQPNHAAAV